MHVQFRKAQMRLLIGLFGVLLATPGRSSTLALQITRENDVTPFVVMVGNPAQSRYSRLASAYARNVWDMEVYDDRLYLGSGNSNNDGPAPNSGPVNVWYYDAGARRFGYDYTLPEEQLDLFEIINGDLFIPGHDPHTGGNSTGHIYELHDGQWSEWADIRGAAHVYDVYSYQGRIYAATGLSNVGGDVIVSTTDNGKTWVGSQLPLNEGTPSLIIISRAWKFFEVGGNLFVSVRPALLPIKKDIPNTNSPSYTYDLLSSAIYRLVGIDNDVPQFEQVTTDFFLGLSQPSLDRLAGRVARPVQFGSKLVYLGVKTVTDHNWIPFGLFSVDADYQVLRYSFDPNEIPHDLLVDNSVLYALLSQFTRGHYQIRVMATCDLQSWREVLRFQSTAFSRSFALYRGDFYFGQGTETGPLLITSGNILRVSPAYFQPGCTG